MSLELKPNGVAHKPLARSERLARVIVQWAVPPIVAAVISGLAVAEYWKPKLYQAEIDAIRLKYKAEEAEQRAKKAGFDSEISMASQRYLSKRTQELEADLAFERKKLKDIAEFILKEPSQPIPSFDLNRWREQGETRRLNDILEREVDRREQNDFNRRFLR